MNRTWLLERLLAISVLSTVAACASPRQAADRGLTLTTGDAATCRPIGPPKTLAHGWAGAQLRATPTEHEVALGFFQMPRTAMGISVDPWGLSVSREVRRTVGEPPTQVVPDVTDDGLSVDVEAPAAEVSATSDEATLVVWQPPGTNGLQWNLRRRDGHTVSRSIGTTSSEVSLDSPSAIALPDGRFAIAFAHVCPAGRAAMVLTLDTDGAPLGDPTAVWPQGDALSPRLALARDGRAMVAFFDDGGRVRGVPIACSGALAAE